MERDGRSSFLSSSTTSTNPNNNKRNSSSSTNPQPLLCEEAMLTDSDPPTPRPGDDEDMASFEESRPAHIDPTLINDPRVLNYMLKVEDQLLCSIPYFRIIQKDEITPEMRHTVTSWMYEVCDEEHVPESVFLRAINYMDRFLSVTRINRSQFQLLGAACILISSKWTGSLINTEKLIFYTANSITLDMLLNWEMMILAQFKWDAFTLIPTDFVEQILHRLPKDLWKATKVKEKTTTYIAFCATDHNFCIHTPSMIASASIATSIYGNSSSLDLMNEILNSLHQITKIETDVLKSCVDQLKMKIDGMMENYQVPGSMHPGYNNQHSSHNMETNNNNNNNNNSIEKLAEFEKQAETPTDVGDIQF